MKKRELTSIAVKARDMRKELKSNFPDTKFSVRSKTGSGNASIRIGWTDFPPSKHVREVIGKYEDVDRCEASGEILQGGNDYIFTNHDISDGLRERITSLIPEGLDNWQKQSWFSKAMEELYEDIKG